MYILHLHNSSSARIYILKQTNIYFSLHPFLVVLLSNQNRRGQDICSTTDPFTFHIVFAFHTLSPTILPVSSVCSLRSPRYSSFEYASVILHLEIFLWNSLSVGSIFFLFIQPHRNTLAHCYSYIIWLSSVDFFILFLRFHMRMRDRSCLVMIHISRSSRIRLLEGENYLLPYINLHNAKYSPF